MERRQRLVDIQSEIDGYKQILAQSDYKALKYAEGYITEEDYAEIKAARQELRDKINALESEAVMVMESEDGGDAE